MARRRGDREFLGEVHRGDGARRARRRRRGPRGASSRRGRGAGDDSRSDGPKLRSCARGSPGPAATRPRRWETHAREAVALAREAGDEGAGGRGAWCCWRAARRDVTIAGTAASHLAAARRSSRASRGDVAQAAARDLPARSERLTADLQEDTSATPISMTPPPPSVGMGSGMGGNAPGSGAADVLAAVVGQPSPGVERFRHAARARRRDAGDACARGRHRQGGALAQHGAGVGGESGDGQGAGRRGASTAPASAPAAPWWW